MNDPRLAALAAAPPPWELPGGSTEAALFAAASLVLAGFFSLFRRALQRSVPGRVLEPIEDEGERKRLEPLLERADSLVFSATALRLIFDALFLGLVLVAVEGGLDAAPTRWWLALLVAVPLLLLVDEMLPAAISAPFGDRLLRRLLPLFRWIQLPAAALVHVMSAVRSGLLRLFGLTEQNGSSRPVVEELREVIEETDFRGQLDETEREIIENVMEFHDADVGEVMTPRTEISAVEVGASVDELVRCIEESGHSRVPIFDGSLDKITGVVSARDVIKRLAGGGLEGVALSELARPAFFVPETKLVSELLAEFRGEKLKLAIVLDEYGGTAGLVTMGDVLAEIVGDFHDEWDADSPAPIRLLDSGHAEVQANQRVSEVNEELGLEVPEEEDYETLGGFVLSQLGRFPKGGETFVHGDVEFEVLEANDRRVLRVGIRRLAPGQSA